MPLDERAGREREGAPYGTAPCGPGRRQRLCRVARIRQIAETQGRADAAAKRCEGRNGVRRHDERRAADDDNAVLMKLGRERGSGPGEQHDRRRGAMRSDVAGQPGTAATRPQGESRDRHGIDKIGRRVRRLHEMDDPGDRTEESEVEE